MPDGRSTEGRTLHVLMNPSDSELQSSDIVYISAAQSSQLSTIFARLGRSPTLTVGEDTRFTRAGGMVGLIRSEDRIQIEVNLEALHAARLNMSSRLLQLATMTSNKEPLR